MSSPSFAPIGSFILPAPGSTLVQTQPSEVHPFVGPVRLIDSRLPVPQALNPQQIPVDSSLALLYEQSGGKRLVRFPHKTLLAASKTGTDGLEFFDANPTACPDCARPFYSHNGAGFTILFQCPHWPDDADPVWANEEIDTIIPEPPLLVKRLQSPLGNVLVLKHQALDREADEVDPTARTVYSVPLANVTPADVPAIDAYIVRAAAAPGPSPTPTTHLIGQPNSAVAPSPTPTARLIGQPRGQPSSAVAKSFIPVVLDIFSKQAFYPCSDRFDDNEYDEGTLCLRVSRKIRSNLSLTKLTSRAKAAAAQHTPGGSAIALRKNKPRPRKRHGAYAVIRGHEVGVRTRWSEVEPLIRDFRFALQLGCATVEEAHALVDFASAKGWTSSSPVVRSRPVSLRLVPHPCTSASDLEGRPPRTPADLWYICYVGIHPGVYSSYLECALNTLGVANNVHDHRNTFDAAMDEFMWAQLDGQMTEGWTGNAPFPPLFCPGRHLLGMATAVQRTGFPSTLLGIGSQGSVGRKARSMSRHTFASFLAQLFGVPIQIQREEVLALVLATFAYISSQHDVVPRWRPCEHPEGQFLRPSWWETRSESIFGTVPGIATTLSTSKATGRELRNVGFIREGNIGGVELVT
ncbi:hypothetical protein C8F01DRAFT_1093505 [Mycena amicta]|nr:hypothetical protein C8F01DRAFT_1093505 [Mycena amicta]